MQLFLMEKDGKSILVNKKEVFLFNNILRGQKYGKRINEYEIKRQSELKASFFE